MFLSHGIHVWKSKEKSESQCIPWVNLALDDDYMLDQEHNKAMESLCWSNIINRMVKTRILYA